ncbi:aggregative adherence fimbria II usher protein AafC [Escherichia coli]|uniref:aggregative adherence fimbria II usher protein AafC n=1 Tax=Escherichia coli TaxID=562 RepID=UPI000DE58BFD|nr:aggregative adherence fimbria II usher protein AafC [Escherichia coli]EAB6840293.1 aggregative adherence fimbria II usher protein AafC [Escherichia coli]EER8059317.1 aggregative adherence fimbria II usher protein AafC [Escherichia coli]EES2680150.1 aggregative adherence fimbria II usher protein AafC [Escherichia coli]EEV5734792.1 aggregative adherence fimbria II usher protein AafC [Escherichia coli]EEV5897027.1 aggregative adherence fimbria II usher protein AafC [Escherichia coli]
MWQIKTSLTAVAYSVMMTCTLLHVEDVIARTYSFNSSLLSGGGKGVDLSLFEEGGQLPGIYQTDIILNGSRVDSLEMPFHTEKDENGRPYLKTCLTQEMLARYGVKTEEYPALFRSLGGGSDTSGERGVCADLSAIPQATENYQFAAQQLVLGIPQVALRPLLRGIAPEVLWDDGIPAFLLNWQANAGRSEYRGYIKDVEDYFWSSLEPGINIGSWRIRNLTTWNKSSGQSGKWESLYIRAERGLNSLKSRLTLGENYTPSDIFDSVPFRGGMLSSDESMVPYNQREFAPVVRGIARTQARIEVRQNGYLIQSQTVAPGAFALTDLPVTGSGSDLQVTVRESDGTVQVFTVPFTTPAIALREGYLKYNVMAGQYRSSDDAVEDSTLGQVMGMYGLPWGLTVFGGLQGAEHYQAAALGLGWSLGKLGAVSLDTIHSRGQQKGYNYETGNTWRIRYNKSFELTGTSFTAASYQYSSSGYHTLSDVLETYRDDGRFAYRSTDSRTSRTTVNLSQSLGRWGYLGLNGSRDEYRDRPHQDYIGASYGASWNRMSLSVNWSRNHSTRGYYGSKSRMEDSISIWMSIPLESWLGRSDNNISATAQMQRSTEQNTRYELGLNGRAFDRRLFWEVHEQMVSGSEYNTDTSRLNLRWSGTYGELAGMYSYSSNMRQINAGMSGSMVAHGEGVTFGQRAGDTVTLVAAPGVSGASVGDWPGVRTDFRGYALAGYASPYQENVITLDPTTFPEDAEVPQTDSRVVPTKGAVVRAGFRTRVGGRALVSLTRQDGSSLPFGAIVTLEGKPGETSGSAGVVDDKGRVYLSGLPETGKLKAQWGENSICHADYRLPEEKGPAGIFLTRTVCM